MGMQERLLLAAERPDQVGTIDPQQRNASRAGLMLTEQCTPGIEADPVTVKQLVHMGGKQQAVGTAEPLAVVANPARV